VLVIGFNGSRTDPEFLRDPAGSETGTAERKDMQFAVGQVRYLGMCCRAVDDFVNGAQCDSWTDIKLTCENIFNGTDQLFPRTGFHPSTLRRQRAMLVPHKFLRAASTRDENPGPGKRAATLFEKKNPVVMAKEWFNDKQIWLMLSGKLSGCPFISCEVRRRYSPDHAG